MSITTVHTMSHEVLTSWNPAPLSTDDVLSASRVNQWSATLDLDERFGDGAALPLLWQWGFFLDWPRTSELGVDGHPRDGHFLPPIPNRRRMFAGGRLTVRAPLIIGENVTRRSELTKLQWKHGRTGELLFVTVRHSYLQSRSIRLVEEQDLVYRSEAVTSTTPARVAERLAEPTTPWSVVPAITPSLLFRFSALTANTHRIHYDEPYTTGTEGFPALVVHGPLLAVYMVELIRSRAPEATVREFGFRLRRPVFVDDAIKVEGIPDASSVALSIGSGASTVHATATAVLE